MKSLRLLVLLVAVFEENCRAYSVGPDGPDLNNLPSELEKTQTYDVDHHMKKDVNEQNHIKLRGKAETRILKKLLENLKSMEDKQTQANSEMKMELQAIESHQDNITKMNAELKIDLQSVKENQRNITGKLYYQDTKFDNITNMNTELKIDLQSVKENQENITGKLYELQNFNSNQDTKLDNITNMNTELKIELQSLKENQGNMTGKLNSLENINSNQDTKLNNIINKNTELKENQGNISGKLDSIIDSIRNMGVNGECHEGFFKWAHQCFKLFNDTGRSYTDAKTKCLSEGLVLAKPLNLVDLRSYLVTNYAGVWVRLGARGDGSVLKWDQDGATLSSSSSAWYPGHPSGKTSSNYCLILLTSQGYLTSHPTKPLYSENSCTNTGYHALCELIM